MVVNKVRGLEIGVYHYSIQAHQIEQLEQCDLRQRIAATALGQGMCATVGVVFIWTAVFERCKMELQPAGVHIYLSR